METALSKRLLLPLIRRSLFRVYPKEGMWKSIGSEIAK